MLTFEQVLHARLGGLHDAVGDWTTTVGRLTELAGTATDDLTRRADKADWSGENAGITREFVRSTAKEFQDAVKEATGIRNVLRDAHAEFTAARDSLRQTLHDAPGKGIRIDPDGVVSYLVHPDRRGKDYDGPEPTEQQFAEVRAAVKAAVDRADSADVTASRALRTLVGKDGLDFSGTSYDSLAAAGRAQDAEDARAAARIVAKGDSATPAEIARLNTYFEQNRDDPYFATQFALDVGPEGTLAFWADLGDPSDGSRLGIDDRDALAKLQKNWSMTLATATHSTSPEMTAWKSEVIALGGERIPTRGTTPYGFQVMSNLMRYGEFDKGFLHDYGDALVVAENKLTVNGRVDPAHTWMAGPNRSHLNWSGKDLGNDPVTGFMEALGHNPKASAAFFTSDIDLTPDDGGDHRKVDAFDWLTRDRKWPEDVVSDGESDKFGYDSLGHALESATLGHAYDHPEDGLVRTDAGADVMAKIVDRYGGDAGLLTKQSSLADSLGVIGAGYVDDINWALSDDDPGSVFAPRHGTTGHVKVEAVDARKFLSSLGQHPTAYATVTDASRLYTTSVLESQLGPDGHLHHGAAMEAVRTGAQIQGILDHSRAEQVAAEAQKGIDDYGKTMDKRSGWLSLGVGAGIGVGAAFAPISAPAAGVAAVLVPLAVENGQGVMGQYADQLVGEWVDVGHDSHDDAATEAAHNIETNIYSNGEKNARAPLYVFMDAHGMARGGDSGQMLLLATESGYSAGALRDAQQGNLPQTG